MAFVVHRGVLFDKKKAATVGRYVFQIGHTQEQRNGTLRRILSFGRKLLERIRALLPPTAAHDRFFLYEVEKLNVIRHILTDRLNRTPNIFEEKDKGAIRWADIYWQQLAKSGKIDVSDKAYEEKRRMVNMDELRLKEVGAEWMCYRSWNSCALGKSWKRWDTISL